MEDTRSKHELYLTYEKDFVMILKQYNFYDDFNKIN